MPISTFLASLLLATLTTSPTEVGERDHPVVHIVGDSIVAGVGTEDRERQSYPALLADDGWRVRDHGIPGTCLVLRACLISGPGNMLERVQRLDIVPRDVVLVAAGTNDLAGVTSRQLRIGYRQVIRYIRQAGGHPVVATITPFAGGDDLGQFRGPMDVTRVEVNAWTVHTLPHVDLSLALGGDRLLPRYDSGDGLHPNEAGARRLAVAVSAALCRRHQLTG